MDTKFSSDLVSMNLKEYSVGGMDLCQFLGISLGLIVTQMRDSEMNHTRNTTPTKSDDFVKNVSTAYTRSSPVISKAEVMDVDFGCVESANSVLLY